MEVYQRIILTVTLTINAIAAFNGALNNNASQVIMHIGLMVVLVLVGILSVLAK